MQDKFSRLIIFLENEMITKKQEIEQIEFKIKEIEEKTNETKENANALMNSINQLKEKRKRYVTYPKRKRRLLFDKICILLTYPLFLGILCAFFLSMILTRISNVAKEIAAPISPQLALGTGVVWSTLSVYIVIALNKLRKKEKENFQKNEIEHQEFSSVEEIDEKLQELEKNYTELKAKEKSLSEETDVFRKMLDLLNIERSTLEQKLRLAKDAFINACRTISSPTAESQLDMISYDPLMEAYSALDINEAAEKDNCLARIKPKNDEGCE